MNWDIIWFPRSEVRTDPSSLDRVPENKVPIQKSRSLWLSNSYCLTMKWISQCPIWSLILYAGTRVCNHLLPLLMRKAMHNVVPLRFWEISGQILTIAVSWHWIDENLDSWSTVTSKPAFTHGNCHEYFCFICIQQVEDHTASLGKATEKNDTKEGTSWHFYSTEA